MHKGAPIKPDDIERVEFLKSLKVVGAVSLSLVSSFILLMQTHYLGGPDCIARQYLLSFKEVIQPYLSSLQVLDTAPEEKFDR